MGKMTKNKKILLSRRELLRVSAAATAYYIAKRLGLMALLTGVGASLTACSEIDNEKEATPMAGGVSTIIPGKVPIVTVTPNTELTTSVPTSTRISPTPTFEPAPTLDAVTYPRNSARFLPLIESNYSRENRLADALRIQSFENLQRLIRLGLEGKINAIKKLFIEEEVRRTGHSEEDVSNKIEWEYYLIEGKSWLVIPRDKRTGQYIIPVITDQPCEGVTGRKIDPSLATTLGKPGCEGDFFDLERLEWAGGLGETRQVVFRDPSGWFVFGEASDNTKKGFVWYDMKKERHLSWTAFENFAPVSATSVKRAEIVKEGTTDKEIVWTATTRAPGVGWQYDQEIQDWKLDIHRLLAEVGVEYSETTSSHFKANFGEFNFRIPRNLSQQIGKPYIQVPQDVLEKMYLHAMGRYMLFDRRTDPEKYSEFFTIAEAIRRDELSGGKRRFEDWPEFRTAAKKVLENGPAPLELKPMLSRETWGLKGEVRNVKGLDFNFVSKEKYQEILSLLESASISLFTAHHLMRNFGYDAERVLFVNGLNITVFSYDRGWTDQLPILPHTNPYQYVGAPLEKLPAGMDADWYLNGLHTLYNDCLLMTVVQFFNVEDQTFFDPVNSKPWTENNYPRYHFKELSGSKQVEAYFGPQE